MESGSTGDLLGVLALLVASSFFSASEAGFMGASVARMRQFAERGDWRARLAEWMLWHRPHILAVLLVGITASNYSAERLATQVAVGYNPVLGPIIAAVVMTAVVVLFCDVLPIHLAARTPEATAVRGAPILVLASVALAPAVATFWTVGRIALRLMGVRMSDTGQRVSEEHLRAVIDVGTAQGVIDEDERLWLHRVLNFGELTAGQVMTPRPDLVAVSAETPAEEALRLGLEVGHSRLPVYDGTIDTVVGLFHLKDILQRARAGEMSLPVREVARQALFVPDSLPADELLHRLQAASRTAAVVKDEFGGTAGLVTIEDLLEEIVGAIQDEYDVGEVPEVVHTGPDEWSCSGLAKPQAIEETTGVELPDGDWDTLGGFILSLREQVPQVGEVVTFGPLEFSVMEMDESRIARVVMRRLPASDEEEGGELPRSKGTKGSKGNGGRRNGGKNGKGSRGAGGGSGLDG